MSQTLTLKDEGNWKLGALIGAIFGGPGPLLAGYCSDPARMADLHADGGSFTTRLRIHHCAAVARSLRVLKYAVPTGRSPPPPPPMKR